MLLSLGFSWLWQFLRFSLFLMTFTKLGGPGQVYWVGICLIFSHDQTGAMGFQEQDHRGKVPFSSQIISRVHFISMIYGSWCWSWSPGQGSICQVSLLESYSHFPSWSACCPHLGESDAPPPPFRVKYQHYLEFFFMRDWFSPPIYWFTQHIYNGVTDIYFTFGL